MLAPSSVFLRFYPRDLRPAERHEKAIVPYDAGVRCPLIVAVADTHAVIWYLYNDQRLSADARLFMENASSQRTQIALSAISLVEMVYLIEKGRIASECLSRLVRELDHPASFLVEHHLDLSIARALSQVDAAQIPDMPDRIVAATALHLGVPVISRDGRIRASSIQTIW